MLRKLKEQRNHEMRVRIRCIFFDDIHKSAAYCWVFVDACMKCHWLCEDNAAHYTMQPVYTFPAFLYIHYIHIEYDRAVTCLQ